MANLCPDEEAYDVAMLRVNTCFMTKKKDPIIELNWRSNRLRSNGMGLLPAALRPSRAIGTEAPGCLCHHFGSNQGGSHCILVNAGHRRVETL